MMFTGPRAMNSYPYQINHMPSTHYYHPNWESTPMQAENNPTGRLMHEPWPGYYGCQVPMVCPNCSSHGHSPNPYYLGPHCQQFPTPPPHCYGGYYPPYPQPCYLGYVPPPHYSMELPRYEYDKNALGGFHCCGCPNHQRNLKEEKGVKIEEHEPDIETKKSESLVPSGVNKFSYPILWIPSDYGANKENFRSADKEVDDKHDKQAFSYVTRPQRVQEKKWQESPPVMQHQQDSQPAEQDSTRYGWFPLDMNSLRKLTESGVGAKSHGEERRNVDERSRKDVENKNQHKQFPYNIIWLPYDWQGEKGKSIASTEPVEKAPAISGDVPSNSEHPASEAEKIRTEGSSGHSKTIPVKKLQDCIPKPSVESKEQMEAKQSGGNLKTIPVKQVEEFVPKPIAESKELKGDKEAKGKADEELAQKGVQSSSPTKKSKLPPICLRVDPPKKKNGSGNGSSRSPSPPGDKKRQSPDDLKASEKSETMQPSMKDIKVVAKDEKPSYNKIEVLRVPQNENKESVSDKSADSKEKAAQTLNDENSGVTARDDREVQTENGQGDTELKGQDTGKPTKKSLSETEAALVIQSSYRGYEVRRTEPLKKLRQIAKVRDEVHKVRKRIEDLVSSGGNSIDKERAAIGETIMKLLLKLDTIQGLLPRIRDFRKCVTKELIVLQEKLDSITCQNAAPQEACTVEEETKHFSMDEGHNDGVENRKESSSTDSGQVEVLEVNSECANEFSNDHPQREGYEYNAGISEESPRDPVQEESIQSAEQVSVLNDGSHEGEMKVKEIDGELAYSMNQVPSCQPPITEDLACDLKKEENLEAASVSSCPANVGTESGSLDEVTISPAELGAIETDFNVGEQHPEDVSKESEESPIGLESVAGDAMPNDVTQRNEEDAEYLLAELPREVLDYEETNKETPEMEADIENTLRELPIQVIDYDEANSETPEMADKATHDEKKPEKDPGSDFSREAAFGDTTSNHEDVDVDVLAELPHELPDVLAELPHELPEPVGEDKPADVSSSEVLEYSTEVELSSENHEPEPELQATEFLAQLNHEPESVNSSIDTDVVILEQDAGENVLRDGERAVSDIASSLNEETKATQMPGIEYGSLESKDQDYGDEKDSAKDKLGCIGAVKQESFGKHSDSEAQQTKDEDETSELSSESQDFVAEANNEEIDKKMIEENERMKEMLNKLITYGKQQQDLISSLSSKVVDLEKRLARKKATKEVKRPRVKVLRSKCGKSGNGLSKERAMGVAS